MQRLLSRRFVGAPLVAALLALGGPALAADSALITSGELKDHVGYLASDALEGRGTATKGERLAARYIGGEPGVPIQQSGRLESAQHGDHHEIASGEISLKPFGITYPHCERGEPRVDRIDEHRQPPFVPVAVAFHQ